MSERILQQADQRAGEQTSHLASPRHREENHHQQGQVKEREEMQPQGQKSLQKQGNQRNDNGHRSIEPVDLYLILRCVGNGHASAVYPPKSQFPVPPVQPLYSLPAGSPAATPV